MLTAVSRAAFLKPGEGVWKEDRLDIDLDQATTFIFNQHLSLALEEQRQRLPIFQNRSHILFLLEKYQVLILLGETGCGKSTQVPQYLYEAGWAEQGKIIGITEPRRLAATTLASRVAEEKGCLVGQLVGYSIRFDERFSSNETKIKYMTEGILMREMMADPLLRNYSVIMLDEVHERTLNTDIVMGLLKKVMKRNKSLRLIVSSATVDAEQLYRYFNINLTNDESKDTAVIMSVKGRTYPVDIFYIAEPTPDYVKAVVDTAVKIHSFEPPGDILAFLTGSEEVDKAVSLLKEHAIQNKSDKMKMLILPIYGSLPNSEQLKVFRYAPRGVRKIVIATNIAETSITIPGIVYVVDCGFVKLRWFNPDTYTDMLAIVPISQASANQRAGRAGRVRSGKAFRLYTEKDYNELLECTPPEMQRTDLSSPTLQMKALGVDNVLRFDFPSRPPSKNLLCAVELLHALGAIDSEVNLTNDIGIKMAEFPISPLLSKALLNGGEMGCSKEIAAIIAMLQVQNIFLKPIRGEDSRKARRAKIEFAVKEGDLLTLLNVYNAYLKHNKSEEWCHTWYLNSKGLKRVDEIHQQMCKLLQKLDIPLLSCKGDSQLLCRCIASALFPNAAYLHHSGVYRHVRSNQELHIHPTSVLYTLEQPKYVLYCEVLHTTEVYIRDLTVVDESLLLNVAPHFYHITTGLS